MNHEQLNQVAAMLEANGITATKELVFSVCIKTLVDAGIAVPAAYDAVMGAGAFAKLSAGAYDALTV